MDETEAMVAIDHEKSSVCVLDASTYVGFWVLKKLLAEGYRVHAAVQKNGMFSFFQIKHRDRNREEHVYIRGLLII